MKKYIVAIGGGEVGKLETLSIDKEIVGLSNKKNPRLLFIPTASSDSEIYIKKISDIYGERLGCKIDNLLLISNRPSKEEIEEKILASDIVYVGGGNTLKMMKLWRSLGVDKILKIAYKRGIILCGLSAGAICWFEYGHSDSMSFYNSESWDYIRVKSTALLRGTLCPHFNGQTNSILRKDSFIKMIKKFGGSGIGIDNHAAIVFRDDECKVIRSRNDSMVYKIFKKSGNINVESVKEIGQFFKINNLYL